MKRKESVLSAKNTLTVIVNRRLQVKLSKAKKDDIASVNTNYNEMANLPENSNALFWENIDLQEVLESLLLTPA